MVNILYILTYTHFTLSVWCSLFRLTAAPKVRTSSILYSRCSSYCVLNVIGQGCFGKVAKCQNLQTKQVVAVKILKPDLKQDITKEVDFSRLSSWVTFLRHFSQLLPCLLSAGVHVTADWFAKPWSQQLCQVLRGVPVHGTNLSGIWNTGEESQRSD